MTEMKVQVSGEVPSADGPLPLVPLALALSLVVDWARAVGTSSSAAATRVRDEVGIGVSG